MDSQVLLWICLGSLLAVVVSSLRATIEAQQPKGEGTSFLPFWYIMIAIFGFTFVITMIGNVIAFLMTL